jgi:hypothetical protein
MITLEKAKAKAIEYNDIQNSEISKICDVGHSWVFSFRDVESKEEYDVSPISVSKANGIVGEYFPPNHLNDKLKVVFDSTLQ